MSERIEKLIKDYPQMKMEARCLENQIRSFRGVSETDVIETMYYQQPEGDRVQTSGTSDKTAKIALSYHERMERINREWYDYLEERLLMVTDELSFFESALKALSGKLPEIMTDMVIERMTWDSIAEKYYVSQRMVGKYRKKAIAELDALYEAHDAKVAEYILN